MKKKRKMAKGSYSVEGKQQEKRQGNGGEEGDAGARLGIPECHPGAEDIPVGSPSRDCVHVEYFGLNSYDSSLNRVRTSTAHVPCTHPLSSASTCKLPEKVKNP